MHSCSSQISVVGILASLLLLYIGGCGCWGEEMATSVSPAVCLGFTCSLAGAFWRLEATSLCRLRHRASTSVTRGYQAPPCPAASVAAYQRGKDAGSQGVYVPDELYFHPGALITLPVGEQRHLRARRVRFPALIRLFNGRGGTATATLCEGGDVARVIAPLPETGSVKACRLSLDVGFCVPRKASRADWAVEKLTELGVSTIICVDAERTSEPVSEAKVARFRRLCVSAAKQSAQDIVPEVRVADSGIEALTSVAGEYDISLVLSPDGAPLLQVLSDMAPPSTTSLSALIVAGPEGGFSDAEEARLVASGFVRAVLGPGRLRVETAVISAAAGIVLFADALRVDRAE
jgi:16S rRNA (uracil1498-N3)-methyltransferase